MQTLKQFKKIKSKAAFDIEGCKVVKLLSEARQIFVLILESTLDLLSTKVVQESDQAPTNFDPCHRHLPFRGFSDHPNKFDVYMREPVQKICQV
jgi:hypothetical protein